MCWSPKCQWKSLWSNIDCERYHCWQDAFPNLGVFLNALTPQQRSHIVLGIEDKVSFFHFSCLHVCYVSYNCISFTNHFHSSFTGTEECSPPTSLILSNSSRKRERSTSTLSDSQVKSTCSCLTSPPSGAELLNPMLGINVFVVNFVCYLLYFLSSQ